MRSLAIALVLSLSLSGCASSGGGMSSGNNPPGGYCYEHPAVCGIIGAAIVAGGFALLGHSHHGGCQQEPPQERGRGESPKGCGAF